MPDEEVEESESQLSKDLKNRYSVISTNSGGESSDQQVFQKAKESEIEEEII